MRHIVGSSEPDVIFGFDNDQNRGRKKKDKGSRGIPVRAEAVRGRYFVHLLISKVKSTKITALPGTRTVVADLCMFGLATRDEGGPEIGQRKRANEHQRKTSFSAVAK